MQLMQKFSGYANASKVVLGSLACSQTVFRWTALGVAALLAWQYCSNGRYQWIHEKDSNGLAANVVFDTRTGATYFNEAHPAVALVWYPRIGKTTVKWQWIDMQVNEGKTGPLGASLRADR